MKSPLLKNSDAAAYLGVSRTTLYRMLSDGRLPSPVRLSERRVAHRIADLDKLISGQSSTAREENH